MNSHSLKPCPICHSEPEGSFQAKHVIVLKCSSPFCGHLYAANAPKNYGVQKHLNPEQECEQFFERNKRLSRFWQKKGFINANSKVLDFGAGSGHIALGIREFIGVRDIECVEADVETQKWLKKNNLIVKDGITDCSSDYDSVLLVELIEHIDSPVELLREIKTHMSSHGRLFLSTPCGETNWGARATNAYDTVEHVHFFTQKSLYLALTSAGFKDVDFCTVPAMYPLGKGFAARPVGCLKNLFRFARNRLFGYNHLVVFAK